MKRGAIEAALYGEGLLGESLAPKKSGELSEKFMVPPFTVLSAREGWWQDRKRAWLAMGIKSELGRGEDLVPLSNQANQLARYDKEAYRARIQTELPEPSPVSQEGEATIAAPVILHKPQALEHRPPAYVEPRHIQVVHEPPPPVAYAWTAPAELPTLANRGIKRLCVDVETKDEQLDELGPGVRRPGNYIVGLGVGTDDGHRWYFPVRHEGGGNLDPGLVKRWAKEELGEYSGELVGANLLYDLDYLTAPDWGVSFANVKAFHDVMVAEPLIDEWRMSYSLDNISKDYLGEGKDEKLLREAAAAYGATTDKAVKKTLWRLPAAYVGPYAEGDVDRPLRILPEQLKKLADENLNDIYAIERKLIPILLAMRQRGVRVDTAHAERVRADLVVRRDAALAKVRAIAGQQAELMAPDSFSKAFLDRGLNPPLTPKTRKLSVTKDWLKAHRTDPLAAAILEGRGIETVINTFIDGHIFTHAINGRIHCEFNQLKGDDGGTIARFSSSNPNLQNLPARDEEMAPLVRGVFVPEDGEEWERHDESQIEYRLLVHFAIGQGAEEARRKYNEDPKTDFHKLCADFCGIDPEDKLKRKGVKGINFGKTYGAGAETLALIIGCSLKEAEEFVALYERELPFTKSTYDAAMRWGDKQGFVTTILGRRQRFSLWEPMGNYDHSKPPMRREAALAAYGQRIKRYKTYAALNRKLQGSGADLLKKAMVDTYEAGVFGVLGAPLLTVHDELDWSVPRTDAGRDAVAVAKRCMEGAVKLKVPVLVEADRGPNWGACS